MRLLLIMTLLCPFLTNCQPITIKGKRDNGELSALIATLKAAH